MNERLVMTANPNEGSFVKNLQGKTGVGFQEGTHVHKDWYAKTIDYDQAIDLAEDAARQREDIIVSVENVCGVTDDDGNFMLAVGDRMFSPTDHALQQLSIKADLPSSSVLRELRSHPEFDGRDARVMASLLNNSLRRVKEDKQFCIRTYSDGTCRAFLSDRYAPVDNRWYLETLKELLPSGRLSHWRGDEDTMYGNIILPDSVMDYGQSDDSDYGGMVSVGNCEIGRRTVSQRPSLFRSICMNGCIWGQVQGSLMRRRHIGNIDLDVLKIAMAENIEYQLPLIDDGIRKFLSLKTLEIAPNAMDRMIAAVCKTVQVKKGEALEVLNQWNDFESHEPNAFGLLNAFTRAGQKFDNESWVRFDEIGGSLIGMSSDKFSHLKSRADLLTDSEMSKVFGVAV